MNLIYKFMLRLRRRVGSQLYGRDDFRKLWVAAHPRHQLADALRKEVGAVVKYGPFAGLRLPDHAIWGGLDYVPMVLGIYELPVVDRLQRLSASSPSVDFLDIGGGDGFFCTGMLKAGLCHQSIVFEVNVDQRRAIQILLEDNGVSDNAIILGRATIASVSDACRFFDLNSRQIVLIDIEGGEFDLLCRDLLLELSRCHIIVEIHKWADLDGSKRRALRQQCSEFFKIEEFGPGPRSLDDIQELASIRDDLRWMACSEGRREPGLWWELTPLGNNDHNM